MQARLRPTHGAIALLSCLAFLEGSPAAVWSGGRGSEPPASECKASVEANRKLILAFYRRALVEHRPRESFELYVSPGFVEHKPDIEGGTREGAIAFLEGLIAELPRARWDIIRTIAEDDLVFLHARFTPAPGAPAYAVADIFRINDCRIVEHWDVVAGPPDVQRNPNPRF